MKYGILILVISIVSSFAQDVTVSPEISSDVTSLSSPSLPPVNDESSTPTLSESLLPLSSSLPSINNESSISTLPTEFPLTLLTQATPSPSTLSQSTPSQSTPSQTTPSQSTLPPIPTLSQQTIPFLIPGSSQTSMPFPWQPTGGPWQPLSGPWQSTGGSWQPTWQPPAGWVLQPSNWTQTSNSGQPLMWLQISNSSFIPFSSFPNGISQPTPSSSSNSSTSQVFSMSQVPLIPFLPSMASTPLGPQVPLTSDGMSSIPIAPPLPSIPFMSSIPLGQQTPTTPPQPQESSTPSIPLMASLPEVPSISSTPQTPQVSSTPSISSLPQVPLMSTMPLMPSAPQVPLMPFTSPFSSLSSGQYNLDDVFIRRPCEVFDKFCIRKYFKRHSNCKEVYGPVPEPLYRDQSTAYYPHLNLTVVSNNLQYYGLNGRVEEFYINKKTDKLVLAVEFRNLTTTSNSVSLRFHRNAQEPIVLQDTSNSVFASIVVTITIPNLKDLQLARAEVFGYINDAQPIQAYGPQGFVGADPSVLQVATEMAATVPISVQELQLTESVFYIGKYIEYDICDFGLAVL